MEPTFFRKPAYYLWFVERLSPDGHWLNYSSGYKNLTAVYRMLQPENMAKSCYHVYRAFARGRHYRIRQMAIYEE